MDARGYVVITDRTKDMFIMGGFNAYPAEIENLNLRNEAIAQVAASADDIRDWSRGEMANYKAPRYVVLVGELPLNATGKVLKYELRERGAAILAG